jgi:hypothetical protein
MHEVPATGDGTVNENAADLAGHYFLGLAAAFVRGKLPDAPCLPDAHRVDWIIT